MFENDLTFKYERFKFCEQTWKKLSVFTEQANFKKDLKYNVSFFKHNF